MVAVVHHLGSTHTSSRLKIIRTNTLAAIDDAADVDTHLCHALGTGMSYWGVWQAGDIGYIFALRSQRYGNVGLAASIFAGKHVTLCQAELTGF